MPIPDRETAAKFHRCLVPHAIANGLGARAHLVPYPAGALHQGKAAQQCWDGLPAAPHALLRYR